MFNIGAYEVLPITVRSIINPDASSWAKTATTRRPVSDKEKTKSVCVTVHYIYMRHLATDFVFRFVGVTRGGVLGWTDGRRDVVELAGKHHRMTPDELKTELTRLLGDRAHADKVYALVFMNTMKGSEAKEMTESWNEAIDSEAIAHKKEVARKKALVNKNDYVPGKCVRI
jgi:hypothetical protein